MQITISISTFLALAASALALTVTSPAQYSNIDVTKGTTIAWNSVSSDPTSFNIVLTNMNVNPSVRIVLASNVQTSAGSYTVPTVNGASPGENYRVNLESTANSNQGILAQSGPFQVAPAGSTSTSLASFSGSTSSTSQSASTSTVTSTISSNGSVTTITSTGTSTASASSSSNSQSSSSGTASGASASSTGGASSLNTFAGAGAVAMIAAVFV